VKKNGFAIVLVAVVVGLGIIVLGAIVYFRQKPVSTTTFSLKKTDISPIGINETAGNELYTDLDKKISLRHAPNFKIVANPGVLIIDGLISDITITVGAAEEGETATKIFDIYEGKNLSVQPAYKYVDRVKYVIDGVGGEKVIKYFPYTNDYDVMIVVINNGMIYQIFTYFNEDNKELVLRDFEQVVSTIKFL